MKILVTETVSKDYEVDLDEFFADSDWELEYKEWLEGDEDTPKERIDFYIEQLYTYLEPDEYGKEKPGYWNESYDWIEIKD